MAAPGKFQLRATGKQVSQLERSAFPALARSLSGGSQNGDILNHSSDIEISNDVDIAPTPSQTNVAEEQPLSENEEDLTNVSDDDNNKEQDGISQDVDAEEKDNKTGQNDVNANNQAIEVADSSPEVNADYTEAQDGESVSAIETEVEDKDDNNEGNDVQQSSLEPPLQNLENQEHRSEDEHNIALDATHNEAQISNLEKCNEEQHEIAEPNIYNATSVPPDGEANNTLQLDENTGDDLPNNEEKDEVATPINDENDEPDMTSHSVVESQEETNATDTSTGREAASDSLAELNNCEDGPITDASDPLTTDNANTETNDGYEDPSTRDEADNDADCKDVTVASELIDANETAGSQGEISEQGENADSVEENTINQNEPISTDDRADNADLQPVIPAPEIAENTLQENDTQFLRPPTPPPLPPPEPTQAVLTPPINTKPTDTTPDGSHDPAKQSPETKHRSYIELSTPPSTPTFSKDHAISSHTVTDVASEELETTEKVDVTEETRPQTGQHALTDSQSDVSAASTAMVSPPTEPVPLTYRSYIHLDDKSNENSENEAVEEEYKIPPNVPVQPSVPVEKDQVNEEVVSITRSNERIESHGEALILSSNVSEMGHSSIQPMLFRSYIHLEETTLSGDDEAEETEENHTLDFEHQNKSQDTDESWAMPPKILLIPASLRDSIDDLENTDPVEHQEETESTNDTDELSSVARDTNDEVVRKSKSHRVTFESDITEDGKIDGISNDTVDSGLEKDSPGDDVAKQEEDSSSIPPRAPADTVISDTGTVITTKNNVVSIMITDDVEQVNSEKPGTDQRFIGNGDVHAVLQKKDSIDADEREIRSLRQAYRPIQAAAKQDHTVPAVKTPEHSPVIQNGENLERNKQTVTEVPAAVYTLPPGISDDIKEKDMKLRSESTEVSTSVRSMKGAYVESRHYDAIRHSPRNSPRLGYAFAGSKGSHSVDSKLYGYSQGPSSGLMMSKPFSNYSSMPVLKERSKKRFNRSSDGRPSTGSTRTYKSQTMSSVVSSRDAHAYRDTRDVEMISAPMVTIPARRDKYVKSEDIFMKMPPQYQYYASLHRELGVPPVTTKAEATSVNAHRWFRLKAFSKRVFTETGDRFNPRKMVHFSAMKNRKQVYKPQSYV